MERHIFDVSTKEDVEIKMAKSKTENDLESQLSKLEDLVAKLESGDVALEESLKLFEEGVSLYRACKKKMGDIEIKIQKLTDELKDEGTQEDD